MRTSAQLTFSPEEQFWLAAHPLRVGVTEIPPQVMRGDSPQTYRGLAVDFLHQLEVRLGYQFTWVYFDTWAEVLEAAKSRRIDLVFAAQQTPERERYLSFTSPYLVLPNLIVVRRDTTDITSLADLRGKRVVVSAGSAVYESLRDKHPDITLVPVKDELIGLLKVSFGEVPAMVVEPARATYHIDRAGITNLKVAGPTDVLYQLRVASRNDEPMLHSILEKSVASISESERDAIRRRWVRVLATPTADNRQLISILGLGALFALGLTGLVVLWNRQLRRRVAQQTRQLTQELEERRRSEQALRDSERWLADLVDFLPDVTFAVNTDGIVTVWNRAAETFTGIVAGNMLGKSVRDVAVALYGEDRPILLEMVLHPDSQRRSLYPKLSCIGSTLRSEGYVLDSKRRHAFVSGLATPIHDAHANVVGAIETLRDLTEQKQTEDALFNSTERYEQAANTVPVVLYDAIQGSDGVSHFTYLAAIPCRELLEVGPSELIDDPSRFWAFVHPEDRAGLLERDAVALDKKTGYSAEVRIITPSGRTKWITITSRPRSTSLAEKWIWSGFLQDVTEHRSLEERVRQRDKLEAIGQLAGGIAHDFNNQLSGVLGFAELLYDALQDPELRSYTESIIQSTRRAAELTKQLLAFGRKGRVLRATIDVHRLLTEVIELLRRLIDKRVTIHQQFEASTYNVIGDATQLQNAFLNLALNARDAMPDGGQLTFRTALESVDDSRNLDELPSGKYIHIAIEDTGVGMTEETKRRIFEPFFTTKGLGQGTGLGLASVYGTVTSHNGTVCFSSQLGHGSVFDVYLPVSTQNTAEVPSAPTERQRCDTVTHRILLVDDEPLVLNVTGAILRLNGYVVTAFSDPVEALQHYTQHFTDIDLVIVDLSMPKLTGKALYLAMREINAHVLAILASGYGLEGEVQSALDSGVRGFVQKPFCKTELLAKVAETLAYNAR